jgi:cobalt/nickel transport system permease protein
VVATPITQFLSYLAFFLIVALLITAARLPIRTVFLRSLIEIPFVLFAFLMPFFGTGPQVQILGVNVYEAGLLAGLSIVAKGTLGVLIAIVLSATTTARELLFGLERLRIPLPLLNIAAFMLRYLNVINDEMTRMRVARLSRGFQESGIKSWRVLAHSMGALFIRSYERGERVYLAMLARGFRGSIPSLQERTPANWSAALVLPGLALTASLLGRLSL